MARSQADQIVNEANADANEIRLGSMYYTKDKLTEVSNYINATLEAEKANYDNRSRLRLLRMIHRQYRKRKKLQKRIGIIMYMVRLSIPMMKKTMKMMILTMTFWMTRDCRILA